MKVPLSSMPSFKKLRILCIRIIIWALEENQADWPRTESFQVKRNWGNSLGALGWGLWESLYQSMTLSPQGSLGSGFIWPSPFQCLKFAFWNNSICETSTQKQSVKTNTLSCWKSVIINPFGFSFQVLASGSGQTLENPMTLLWKLFFSSKILTQKKQSPHHCDHFSSKWKMYWKTSFSYSQYIFWKMYSFLNWSQVMH